MLVIDPIELNTAMLTNIGLNKFKLLSTTMVAWLGTACDYHSNVAAFNHNDLWQQAMATTKLTFMKTNRKNLVTLGL